MAGRAQLPVEESVLLETDTIELLLRVTEPEVVAELARYQEGHERDQFALNALRVGVLAIRQAGGILDSATLRQEGERILGEIKLQLNDRVNGIANTL